MSRLVPRLVFLALLASGLLLWSQLRRPRDLLVRIDLSEALPGDVVEADVVVRRAGRALARREVLYGPSGAPDILEVPLHAPPGAAEVEVTLVRSRGPARRTESTLRLVPDVPGQMRAR